MIGDDAALVELDRTGVGEHDARVAVPREHRTDGRRHIRRRERGHGDLVNQRLKQVVVLAIDHDDVDRRPAEAFRGRESAESRADDDDSRSRARLGRRLSGHRVGTEQSACHRYPCVRAPDANARLSGVFRPRPPSRVSIMVDRESPPSGSGVNQFRRSPKSSHRVPGPNWAGFSRIRGHLADAPWPGGRRHEPCSVMSCPRDGASPEPTPQPAMGERVRRSAPLPRNCVTERAFRRAGHSVRPRLPATPTPPKTCARPRPRGSFRSCVRPH